MEVWVFDHPDHGRYELHCGYDTEFTALYPDWPVSLADARPAQPVPSDASILERFQRWRRNPPLRLQVVHEGRPLARLSEIPRRRVPLKQHSLDRFVEEPPLVDARCCVVDRSWDHQLLSVQYREGKDRVEWDPPADSLGERFRRRRESSALARVGFPILFGLRRSAWAIAALVLGPLVHRWLDPLIEWLASLFPELPDLPAPPNIWLPSLPTVNIWLPTISLSLPNLPPMPWWLEWVFEYKKIWLPVVLGVVAGITALRNYKKSERFKQERGLHRARGDGQ